MEGVRVQGHCGAHLTSASTGAAEASFLRFHQRNTAARLCSLLIASILSSPVQVKPVRGALMRSVRGTGQEARSEPKHFGLQRV